jgi:hypothetical protein
VAMSRVASAARISGCLPDGWVDSVATRQGHFKLHLNALWWPLDRRLCRSGTLRKADWLGWSVDRQRASVWVNQWVAHVQLSVSCYAGSAPNAARRS